MFLPIYQDILDNIFINSADLDNSFNISPEIDNYTYFDPNKFSLEIINDVNNAMKVSTLPDENDENRNIEFKAECIQKEESSIPELYNLNKIENLMNKKFPQHLSNLLEKSSFSDKTLHKLEISITDKALLGRKRRKKNKLNTNDKVNEDLGRKPKFDTSLRKHNKFCADNIVKKIKRYLLENFLRFVNKIVNKSLDSQKKNRYLKILRPFQKKYVQSEDLLKIIDYKYIDRLNKKSDLLMLNMPFKELFSKEISPRYSKLKSDSNKVIIEKLLEEERYNNNLMFAFNLRFRDWLDIFTYKNDINNLKNYEEEKMINIKNSLEYIDSIIMDIYNTNRDKNYLLYFMLYLYNYERWFILKRGRIRKGTQKQKSLLKD